MTPDRFSTATSTESDRIRAAYAQRASSSTNSLYSYFNDGHLAIVQDRERKVLGEIGRAFGSDLSDIKLLEIGCGTGAWLRQFVQWGLSPSNLFGIDLLESRLALAKEGLPPSVNLKAGDATLLEYDSGQFDLVLQSTVFSSILDRNVCRQIANEMLRVLKPGGIILWYDLRVNNPGNPNVRKISKNEIVSLFPGCRLRLRTITLAPPLARLIAPVSIVCFEMLSNIRFLCTHNLVSIQK